MFRHTQHHYICYSETEECRFEMMLSASLFKHFAANFCEDGDIGGRKLRKFIQWKDGC